jgi:hypothetical protein
MHHPQEQQQEPQFGASLVLVIATTPHRVLATGLYRFSLLPCRPHHLSTDCAVSAFVCHKTVTTPHHTSP